MKKQILVIISVAVILLSVLFIVAIQGNGGEIPDSPKSFVDSLLTPAEIASQYREQESMEEADSSLPKEMTEEWFINHYLSDNDDLKSFDKEVIKISDEIRVLEENDEYIYLCAQSDATFNRVINYALDLCDKLELDFTTLKIYEQRSGPKYMSCLNVMVSDRQFKFYSVQLDKNKEEEITIYAKEVTSGT